MNSQLIEIIAEVLAGVLGIQLMAIVLVWLMDLTDWNAAYGKHGRANAN